MAFEFRDEWINQYLSRGYLIFEGIVPPALLRDLRRECDKARALAHELHGPQAQRLQPIDKYAAAGQLDPRPFKDYCELPELRDVIARLLGPDYRHGQTSIMGILVEPRNRPWNLGWHRDGVVEVPPEAYDELIRAKLHEAWHDLHHFNQVNCAIYEDSCTWFVPASHLRTFDLPGERQTIGEMAAVIREMSDAEAERACLEHCRSFPGAVQVHLGPGDFMVYRQLAWHNGNYTPWARRATLHDVVTHHGPQRWSGWPEAKAAAVERMQARQAAARAG